jgi:hypothetical protein
MSPVGFGFAGQSVPAMGRFVALLGGGIGEIPERTFTDVARHADQVFGFWL